MLRNKRMISLVIVFRVKQEILSKNKDVPAIGVFFIFKSFSAAKPLVPWGPVTALSAAVAAAIFPELGDLGLEKVKRCFFLGLEAAAEADSGALSSIADASKTVLLLASALP